MFSSVFDCDDEAASFDSSSTAGCAAVFRPGGLVMSVFAVEVAAGCLGFAAASGLFMLKTCPRPTGSDFSLLLVLRFGRMRPSPSSSLSELSSSWSYCAAAPPDAYCFAFWAFRAAFASGGLCKSTDSSSTQTWGNDQIFRFLSLAHVIRACLSSCHSILVIAEVCA